MIQRPDIPRSRFTGSWSRKTSFDAGLLVPFMVDEILPGDHMKYNVTAYLRLATPLFPMFDNQRIDTFFFFVPNRLVWANWQKFMGQQTNPGDSIAYTIPNMAIAGDITAGSIYDHFGLPLIGQLLANIFPNTLPMRAYNLIYNEWFRDENLVNSAVVRTTDVGDVNADFALRRRAKSHDYFTACLPWPQKFTTPSIPLTGTAPVHGLASSSGTVVGPAVGFVDVSSGAAAPYMLFYQQPFIADAFNVRVDLSAALAGMNVNAFRTAFLVQQLMERDARGGTRYTELVKSHFGVTSPDARLQRPEYIGGGSSPLNITPVAQTAPSLLATVGALGGAGTSVGQHSASYAATEHGYIIGLINVRSELSYQQGLHKMWTRSTRYDFYWPSLAGLGEQAVLRKEIFATGQAANDELVFGYQERWHEYRTRTSEICGVFRSQAAGTIDQWHLGQLFLGAPVLGQTFIEDTPPMVRVLAAAEQANGQQYLGDILISREATRPIPTFGTPVMLGRF